MLTFITRSCWQRLAKPFPSVPSAHCLGTACAGILPTYWLPTWEWGEPSTLNKKMRDNSGKLFGKLSVPGPTSPVMPMRGHLLGQDLFAGLWRRLERSARPCQQAAGPRTPTHHWEGGKLPSDTPGAKEVTRYLHMVCYGVMQHLWGLSSGLLCRVMLQVVAGQCQANPSSSLGLVSNCWNFQGNTSFSGSLTEVPLSRHPGRLVHSVHVCRVATALF